MSCIGLIGIVYFVLDTGLALLYYPLRFEEGLFIKTTGIISNEFYLKSCNVISLRRVVLAWLELLFDLIFYSLILFILLYVSSFFVG